MELELPSVEFVCHDPADAFSPEFGYVTLNDAFNTSVNAAQQDVVEPFFERNVSVGCFHRNVTWFYTAIFIDGSGPGETFSTDLSLTVQTSSNSTELQLIYSITIISKHRAPAHLQHHHHQ